MAQSRNDIRDSSSDPYQALSQFGNMLRQGRSFSGRERNCCFLNTGATRFANISAVSGIDFPDDGRAAVVTDWDQDGDLDMWMSNRNAPRLRFLRNEVPSGNHFLAVRLVGNGTTTNRDAIGARVEVVQAPRAEGPDPQPLILVKTLRAGDAFLSQSTKWLNFGLGQNKRVKAVVVHWPGGEVERFSDLEADHRYRLVQDQGNARVLAPGERSQLVSSFAQLPRPSAVARLLLVTPVPVSKLSYRSTEHNPVDVPVGNGQAILLNLWASSCAPCIAELKEFTRRADELRAAGVVPIALCTDEFFGGGSDPTADDQLLTSMGFPFPHGLATKELLDTLHLYYAHVVLLRRSLQIPMSFLIDVNGRLTAIYRGKASVEDIIKDAGHGARTLWERRQVSGLLPGRLIRHDQTVQTAERHDRDVRLELASGFEKRERYDVTVDHYHDFLKIHPDSVVAYVRLGNALEQLNQLPEAARAYENALQRNPDHAKAEFGIGMVRVHQENFPDAVAHLQRAVELWSDYAEAHNLLGLIRMRQSQWNEAESHFRDAIRSRVNFAEAHVNLGVVLFNEGQPHEAEIEFRRALEMKPDLMEARVKLSALLMEIAASRSREGDSDDALRRYRQVLEISPNEQSALVNLGHTLVSLHRLNEAIDHYLSVLQRIPNNPAIHNDLGWAIALRGESNNAIEHYRQAIRIDPQYGRAHYNLANALASLEQLEEAIHHYRQFLQGAPNHGEAHFRLGSVLLSQGHAAAALNHLQESASLMPDSPRVLNTLAWTFATHPDTELRRPKESLRLAKIAVELGGGSISAHLDTLAAAWAVSGRFEQAVSTAQKALDLAIAARSKERADNIRRRLILYRRGQPYVDSSQRTR